MTAAAVAAAFVLVLPVLATTVAEATGKGAYLDGSATVSISFKAGVDDEGAFYGELQQRVNGPGTASDVRFHGTVLCYAQEDSTGWFGGIIDSSSDPSLVGDFFEVQVVDNGEGGGAVDEYGIDFSSQEPDCDNVHVRLNDLIRGNIQVH